MSAELKCCSATVTCSSRLEKQGVRSKSTRSFRTSASWRSPTEEIVHTAGFLEDVAAPQFERDLVRLDEIAESDEADPYDVLKEALEDQEFDKAVRLLIERDPLTRIH